MSQNPDSATNENNASATNPSSSTNEQNSEQNQETGGNNWQQRPPKQRNLKRNNRPNQEGGNNEKEKGGFLSRNLIMERLNEISGPTTNLPFLDLKNERKFSGHNRLYIGNLPDEIDEKEIAEILSKYGEVGNIFLNKQKHFAFLTMDYIRSAKQAQLELNQTQLKHKTLRISIAPNLATVKVSNLNGFVTNELLYHSFKVFGDIERAIVVMDENGNSKCKGFVEFVRKSSAEAAIRMCSEECFFLTTSLRPCVLESCNCISYSDGFNENQIKPDVYENYLYERRVGPRFAKPNSFESEYGERLRQLYLMYIQKKEAVTKEFELELEKLEAKMEVLRYDRETEMLREEIRQRELRRRGQQADWDRRGNQGNEDNFNTQGGGGGGAAAAGGGGGNLQNKPDFRRGNNNMGNRFGGKNNQSFNNNNRNRFNNSQNNMKLKFEPPSNPNEGNVISPATFMNNFYNQDNSNTNYPMTDKRRRRL